MKTAWLETNSASKPFLVHSFGACFFFDTCHPLPTCSLHISFEQQMNYTWCNPPFSPWKCVGEWSSQHAPQTVWVCLHTAAMGLTSTLSHQPRDLTSQTRCIHIYICTLPKGWEPFWKSVAVHKWRIKPRRAFSCYIFIMKTSSALCRLVVFTVTVFTRGGSALPSSGHVIPITIFGSSWKSPVKQTTKDAKSLSKGENAQYNLQ